MSPLLFILGILNFVLTDDMLKNILKTQINIYIFVPRTLFVCGNSKIFEVSIFSIVVLHPGGEDAGYFYVTEGENFICFITLVKYTLICKSIH